MKQERKTIQSALKVNKGIAAPQSVNPYLKKGSVAPARDTSAASYCEAIKKGDISMLSRAITRTESRLEKDRKLAAEILEGCLPASGNSIRIGITGTPGVGKSTFIEALGLALVERKHKVAVLAIDPSSHISGGSILGDKTRMEKLAGHPRVFIRPSASSGVLGGVARRTKESILLCEAAGFDVIIVETVGVGQSEVEVKNLVDFFLLLLLPGAGDELQGIKRGIMEVADMIVINKADGENSDKANLAKSQIQQALHLFPPKENRWEVPVLLTSALYHQGIEAVWNKIEDYEQRMKKNGYFLRHRQGQERHAFYETIHQRIWSYFLDDEDVKKEIARLEESIGKGEISAFAAAGKLMEEVIIPRVKQGKI